MVNGFFFLLISKKILILQRNIKPDITMGEKTEYYKLSIKDLIQINGFFSNKLVELISKSSKTFA